MSTKGGYVVGFTVHEAKELSRDGNQVDPLVLVRCLGREYRTELKRNKLAHVKFEESFIWSDIQLTGDEYNSAFIDFELQAANVFSRNDVIGTGKVQLSMVRRRPNHTYVKKWVQLSTDTMKTAKLRITVFSYGEGDAPPRPEDLENDAEETAAHLKDLGAAVMNVGGEQGTTAKTFTTGYNLFVQVHRAEHLGGGAKVYNPYVTVEFAGNTLSTPPAKETHTLAFDECFRLPVSMPVFSDSIIIRVWNKNSWSSDEVIVQGRLSFSLIRTHALQPKWFNFYGFSSEEVPDIASIHASGERPEPNTYQGRILVSARAQKVMKEGDMYKPAAIKGLVLEEPASVSQTILCDIFEVGGCPGAEAYVHCAVGRTAKKVKPVKRAKGDSEKEDDPTLPGIFRFGAGTQNEKGRMAPMDIVMPATPEQQLDVVISIYADLGSIFSGTSFQRVGFARIKMKDVTTWMGQPSAPRWISCKAMAHLPSTIEPGAVLCSLYKCAKVVGEREPCAVRQQKFQLRVYACMARNLATASGGTQPNAFVHAACAGENKRTEPDPKTLSTTEPVWNQCLNLPVRLQVSERDSKAFPEPCQITVYDDCGEEDGLLSKVKNIVGVGNEEDDDNDQSKKKLAEMKQEEDTYTMLTRLGQTALDTAQDHVGVVRGDIMAKKRLGAVSQGRRVIGRVQVLFKRISRPETYQGISMKPQWLKIHGGLMGNTHTGDVLLGFELLKRKHAPIMPERDLEPPMKTCSLFAAILGLRNVDPVNGGDLTKPKITLSCQAVGTNMVKQELAWKKVPNNPLNKDDINRKWILNSKQGYEFCSVLHLEVPLPQQLIWAPSLNFTLFDDKVFVGAGNIPLGPYIPWVKDPHELHSAITPKDEYFDSEDEGEKDEGVYVSEDSDAGEDGPSVQYVSIKIEAEALGVSFNPDDNIVFPPRVQKVQEKSKGAKAGVKQGDWLIGLQLPTNEPEKSMVLWKAQEAQKYLANCDKNRIRPLRLRFRRQLRNEVTVNVKGKEALGFELQPKPTQPPVFRKDNTKSLMYTKQAIDPGWALAAVNAIDTMGMSSQDPRLRSLLQKRPCVLTFRAPGNVNIGSVVNERKLTENKPVQLNGVPLSLIKQDAMAMSKKLGQIRFTRVPKPTPILPNPADLKRLNLHPARAAIIDVRGIIKAAFGGVGDDDGGDEEADHARPSVNGKMEDHFQNLGLRPYFDSVQLANGNVNVGTLKVRIFAIPTVDPAWPLSLPPQNLASKFYNPHKFRQWIKGDTPAVFRVRSYVIRGLNVSGSNSGYGNPYLFFVYGQTPVKLPGQRQMRETEPRFFRTEERDVKMPEQSNFEVGCYDFKEGYEDELIGKSFVDLEDRWFSPKYQEMVRTGRVPIEYRPLETSKAGSLSKGSLEMWIDLIDASTAAEVALSPLRPPSPVEVEIRVVLWTCREISLRLCYDEDTGEPRERIDIMAQCQIDCRAYNGPQPKLQETDVHHSSDGEGEFNWRFVFSKISVTKGVPLDCFLQFIILEHFSFSRPQMLCETLLEMKNYCKRVSVSGESISLEAELPLENQKLKQQLKQDREGGIGVDLDGGDYDYEDEEADEGQYDEEAMNYGEAEEAIPPAGYLKVLVEVFTQAEASSPELKVGLGRNEPNRMPVVTFPKTGRSWQAVLPTALMVVEAVMEAYAGGTKKCRVVMCMLLIVGIIGGLHMVPGESGCKIVHKSCKKQCNCCQVCYDTDDDDETFCYYPIPGYPDNCAGDSWRDVCNCAQDASCGDSTCNRAVTVDITAGRLLNEQWLPQNGSAEFLDSTKWIVYER